MLGYSFKLYFYFFRHLATHAQLYMNNFWVCFFLENVCYTAAFRFHIKNLFNCVASSSKDDFR